MNSNERNDRLNEEAQTEADRQADFMTKQAYGELKPKRGGWRAGSGRKPLGFENPKRVTAIVSGEHWEKLMMLGNGDLSAGLRKALDLAPG